MNARNISILLSLLASGSLCAQVSIDKPVILEGTVPGTSRVEGLQHSTERIEALTAGIAQSGVIHTAGPVTGDHWTVDLPAFGATPDNGSHIVLKVPTTDTSRISITFNGNGPYPLLREGVPLTGDALIAGSMLSIVLANDAFHVLNGSSDLRRPCPTGMVAVNQLYCIEPTERGSADYFQAGLSCAANGRRLCSWGEFISACQLGSTLGLAAMTNNWEWTNSTANEDNCGRVAGQSNCEAAGTWFATGGGPVAFRCCLTR